jgi:hypothetical protein
MENDEARHQPRAQFLVARPGDKARGAAAADRAYARTRSGKGDSFSHDRLVVLPAAIEESLASTRYPLPPCCRLLEESLPEVICLPENDCDASIRPTSKINNSKTGNPNMSSPLPRACDALIAEGVHDVAAKLQDLDTSSIGAKAPGKRRRAVIPRPGVDMTICVPPPWAAPRDPDRLTGQIWCVF